MAILAIIGFYSCRDKAIHVFISNESTQDSLIQLELYINQQKKLNETFRYTSVIPDYESFEFTFSHSFDSIVLDAKTNTGVIMNNVKIPRNENYIFIAYSYKFVNDSIIKPRDLIVSSYKKMPQME